MSKKEIEQLLNKCDNCELHECIGCEITYTDRKKIKEYIKLLEADNYELNNRLNEYMEDMKKIINKLEEKMKFDVESLPKNVIKKYSDFKMEDIDNKTYELIALNEISLMNEILEILGVKI